MTKPAQLQEVNVSVLSSDGDTLVSRRLSFVGRAEEGEQEQTVEFESATTGAGYKVVLEGVEEGQR